MFKDLTFGPIATYIDDNHLKQICKDMVKENWIPMMTIKSGEWFNWLMKQLIPEEAAKTKGVIVTYSYKKTYSA